jgi:hypothetical protein
MKPFYGLLCVTVLLTGCSPCYRRSAYMCPPPCGPARIVSVNQCDISSEGSIISAQPDMTFSTPITSSSGSISGSPVIEGRVNALENDLSSLKSDVGDVQRQNKQIDRKIDKLIDHLAPQK